MIRGPLGIIKGIIGDIYKVITHRFVGIDSRTNERELITLRELLKERKQLPEVSQTFKQGKRDYYLTSALDLHLRNADSVARGITNVCWNGSQSLPRKIHQHLSGVTLTV